MQRSTQIVSAAKRTAPTHPIRPVICQRRVNGLFAICAPQARQKTGTYPPPSGALVGTGRWLPSAHGSVISRSVTIRFDMGGLLTTSCEPHMTVVLQPVPEGTDPRPAASTTPAWRELFARAFFRECRLNERALIADDPVALVELRESAGRWGSHPKWPGSILPRRAP